MGTKIQAAQRLVAANRQAPALIKKYTGLSVGPPVSSKDPDENLFSVTSEDAQTASKKLSAQVGKPMVTSWSMTNDDKSRSRGKMYVWTLKEHNAALRVLISSDGLHNYVSFYE